MQLKFQVSELGRDEMIMIGGKFYYLALNYLHTRNTFNCSKDVRGVCFNSLHDHLNKLQLIALDPRIQSIVVVRLPSENEFKVLPGVREIANLAVYRIFQ